MLSLVCKALNKDCQKWDVNLESLSVIIVVGKPWCLYTVLKKTCASCCAVMLCGMGEILHILENLSIQTSKLSYPCDVGRPDTMSMEISLKGTAVMGMGMYSPYCFWLKAFML